MSSGASISTWDLLQELGFAPDSGVMSDVMPGLSFELGNLKLSASCVMGWRFRPVVLITGWIVETRRIGEICDEMPRQLESREQGIAWLVWILDKAAGGKFEPESSPDWLTQGRQHAGLLPWQRSAIIKDNGK
jgi:hypothetical protein